MYLGYTLSDPTTFALRVDSVVKLALNLDRDAKYEEFDVEVEKPAKVEEKKEEAPKEPDHKKADL